MKDLTAAGQKWQDSSRSHLLVRWLGRGCSDRRVTGGKSDILHLNISHPSFHTYSLSGRFSRNADGDCISARGHFSFIALICRITSNHLTFPAKKTCGHTGICYNEYIVCRFPSLFLHIESSPLCSGSPRAALAASGCMVRRFVPANGQAHPIQHESEQRRSGWRVPLQKRDQCLRYAVFF